MFSTMPTTSPVTTSVTDAPGGIVNLVSRRPTTTPQGEVRLTAGSFDILAEVVCESDDDLVELLNSRIRSLLGVISSETFVYLGLRKQSYGWGTR